MELTSAGRPDFLEHVELTFLTKSAHPLTAENLKMAVTGNNEDSSSSPFSLSSSDTPSVVLVSSVLDGNNYNSWCRAMTIALGAKNKHGFIDGTVKQPSATQANYSAWNRCNLMVQSWIINSCSKDVAQCVLYLESAEEMWSVLRERFAQGNAPRIFEIQREIYSTQQESLSVTLYFNKLDSLWREYSQYSPIPNCTCIQNCACGARKTIIQNEERNKIMKFLMGLNDAYGNVRSQILMMDPLPGINQVFHLVVQEERQRAVTGSQLEPIAMVTQTKDAAQKGDGSNKAAQAQFVQNQVNGKSTYQNSQGYSKNSITKMVCGHCGRNNHTKERCYKLHGYPPGYKMRRNGVSQPTAQLVTAQQGSVTTEVSTSQNATAAITHTQYNQLLSLLQGLKPSANISVPSSSTETGSTYLEHDWHG